MLEADGRELESQIRATGGYAVFLGLDFARVSDWKTVVDSTVREFGRLNGLVNKAGIGDSMTIEDTPIEAWNRVMSVNATAAFLGTKTAIPAMRRARAGGSTVNLSAQLCIVGVETSSAQYQVSKVRSA